MREMSRGSLASSRAALIPAKPPPMTTTRLRALLLVIVATAMCLGSPVFFVLILMQIRGLWYQDRLWLLLEGEGDETAGSGSGGYVGHAGNARGLDGSDGDEAVRVGDRGCGGCVVDGREGAAASVGAWRLPGFEDLVDFDGSTGYGVGGCIGYTQNYRGKGGGRRDGLACSAYDDELPLAGIDGGCGEGGADGGPGAGR